MSTEILLTPGKLDLPTLRRIVRDENVTLKLDESSFEGINAAARVVSTVVKENKTVYGITTGFGLLANTKISFEELEELQRCIVLSHAAGCGKPLEYSTVRLIMALKINSLARGFSGIRLEVVQSIITLFNKKIYPVIPSKGSVGASGDLAPLSHLAVVLIGEGEAFVDAKGTVKSGSEAMKLAGLEPIKLAAKEGLALLNGTQVSTALTLEGLFLCEDLYMSASVAGALSVEAALGSHKPFDARVHMARGHKGQMDAAKLFRSLLKDSSIVRTHSNCSKVQDPYSLRCQPQVMGAILTQIVHVAEVLVVEANCVSDNPLVFADSGEIISAGNFHAEPVALVADTLALCFAEIGALSERRTALLIDSNLSQLPSFLVNNGGVNSGFMLAQVTSAALASENKSLAHPASVDSLPTSANQEDHVSMATFAGRRLQDMAFNTNHIIAIELLASCQGLDFRSPNKSSDLLEKAKALVRAEVPFYDKDRYFAPDIKKISELIDSECFNQFHCEGILPSFC